ncbi:MAG: response regulator transcription factor, partial [Chitinophagales bacterium]|nr:response regulator transcription factor [Chitinophagales bacterium]
VVMSGTDPRTALSYLERHPVDLLFLDIQMPGMNGLEIIQLTGGQIPVILTTAYDQFAVKGFELDAVDYLLKPFSFERFRASVDKYLQRHHLVEREDALLVRSAGQVHRIPLAHIIYLESLRDYVIIHTTDRSVRTLQSLQSFAERLPESDFMRVHRSFIVSRAHLSYMERSAVVMGEKKIPIGATYRDAVKRWFSQG